MKNKNRNVPLEIALIMLVCIILNVACMFLYVNMSHIWLYYIGLVFGVVAVHFIIMHMVAPCVFMVFRKRYNYKSFWFNPKKFEANLYKKLQVKKWKAKVLAYNQDEYSLTKNTSEEIIMNMCHAEVVHEVIIFVGYLPLLFRFFISEFWFLFITSFLFGGVHMIFVIIQRYNRPRIIKLYEMQKKRYSSGNEGG